MNCKIRLAKACPLMLAVMLVVGVQASVQAKEPGPNGRIAFDRSEGEALLTINPMAPMSARSSHRAVAHAGLPTGVSSYFRR